MDEFAELFSEWCGGRVTPSLAAEVGIDILKIEKLLSGDSSHLSLVEIEALICHYDKEGQYNATHFKRLLTDSLGSHDHQSHVHE